VALVPALAVPLGIAAGLGPGSIAAAVAAGVLAAIGAPAVAAGVGVLFPRFETSTVRSHEVVVPSTWAFGGYVVVLGVALLPVVFTQHPVLAAITVGLLPVDGVAATVGGLVLTGLLLLAVGGLSGGYAARSIGTYRLE
jgi:dolichol kinase